MKVLKIHPDNLGVTFSSLCVFHCFITPFLFLSQAHLAVVPGWWQSLNFLFLLLSFYAIYRSIQNSSSNILKVLLFVSWTFLAFLLISEELELFHLPEALTYASGFSLAFLHVYNKKYCQCDDGTCCAD